MRPTSRPRHRPRRPARAEQRALSHAPVFAALGDRTRLRLLARLSGGAPSSISRLAAGSRLSRQAITKHLRVLESAGLVRSLRRGRESLFRLDPRPIEDAQRYLARVSTEWDGALLRLKSFIGSGSV